MTPEQLNAIEKVWALRQLERRGTRTTRSQNAILQVLSDEDLLVVAVELERRRAEQETKPRSAAVQQ